MDLHASTSPEEFQRQMAEFMKQHFQVAGAKQSLNAETSGTADETVQPISEAEFRFEKKPRDIKAYLDRFVIKQDQAKRVLSVAICDHYHHVRRVVQGGEEPNYTKQNIILIGPTGVGKTYLIRRIADLIGVPFVKGDATKFSETGYVGGDVEDLVRELFRRADGNVERAQYGIIYVDEIDKIAAASQGSGRDVSGRGVQTNLLKLMEETEVPIRSPQDIAGQVQALMEMQHGKKSASVIDTRHILFIVSGAFDGLEKVVRRRMQESTIGFAAGNHTVDEDSCLEHVTTRDFIEYGFEPEFIGRLPVRVVCHSLDSDDLYSILKNSEGSLIRQYEESFGAYGIEVLFQEEGLRRIAELGADEGTGARGLMNVCEKTFREFKFELPSTSVSRFEVTRELVEEPVASLKVLLEQQDQTERNVGQQLVNQFAERFEESHGLKIDFTPAAADLVVSLARGNSLAVREFCGLHFKDFQFGLKLIKQNTGKCSFVVDSDAVNSPDKVLSEWVIASYRDTETGESQV